MTSGLSGSPAETAWTKSREVGLAQRVELGEQPVLGRRLAEHRDTEALDQRQPLLGVEPAVVDHDFGAVRPRPEEHVPDRLCPAGPGGGTRRCRPRARRASASPAPAAPTCTHACGRRPSILRRARRVEKDRLLPRRRVLGRRDRHVPAQLVDGLVEVDDRDGGADLVSHLLDLELERPVGDDEARPGVVDAEREVPRAQHVRETATSPLLSAPSIAPCQSGTFPSTTSTRSPRSSRVRRRCAQRAASPDTSANVRRSTMPSRSTNVSAARSESVASASTTSRVKLKRAGTSHRAGTAPHADLGLRPSAEQGHRTPRLIDSHYQRMHLVEWTNAGSTGKDSTRPPCRHRVARA